MLWRILPRGGVVVMAFVALMALGACTYTVQPDSSAPEVSVGEEATLTEFVLPDGTSCLFSDTGVTVDFDGKHANYTCTPVDASESATQTLAILDHPVVAGPTEYFVDLATIAHTDGGFELHASEVISFTAWEVVLADGRVCLHAGFGATMGFDGKRLNYTCDKGSSTADEVGLMGELTSQGGGMWLAQIDEIGRDANGFVQLSSTLVPVSRVSGMEVTPGGEAQVTPEAEGAGNELLGTLWQWVQTEYGDGTVVTASDPSRYTLLFDETGYVAVQFDCNGGGGPYLLDGSSLTFGALVSTLMACPEGTQDSVFAKDLGEVYSYVIEDGRLYLSLKLDSGIMEFAPAGEGTVPSEVTAEPTEEATPEPTAEATMEATVQATEEAGEEATIEATPEATEEATEEGAPAPTAEATMEPTEEATSEAGDEATAEPTAGATEEAGEEPAEEDTDEATGEATEDAPAGVGSADLAGTSWQWEQSVYEANTLVLVRDPSRYTITFNPDGTLFVKLDCNNGRGIYTAEGSTLTFSPIASTRMGCPADSQDSIFSQDLAQVVSYAFADGNLHLALSDNGVMEFSPMQ